MPDAEPEMLPGLRAAVADSKAKAAATRARKAADVQPAAVDPVARVLVDVPLAHLDRPFDYLVPAKDADTAVPGARVKVRFAGQDVDGYVVERVAESEHAGRLAPLRRVVSPEPVLAPEVVALAAAVAERYAGSRADVLRLAVPPRHATTEAKPSPEPDAAAPLDPEAAAVAWAGHEPAEAFLAHLAAGGRPARSGRRRRPPTGPPPSPTPPPTPGPPDAGRCSSCPTTATSPGSTPRSPPCWARATT